MLSGHLHNYESIISRKVGVEFSCYDLRRTFATHTTKLGMPAYVVKAMLNHTDSTDITATQYVLLHVNDLVKPTETLSAHSHAVLIDQARLLCE